MTIAYIILYKIMILELDTSILDKIPEIKSINQLVLLNLALNDNKSNHQDIHKLLSLVNEEEIQDLIDKNLLRVDISDSYILYKTDKLSNLLKEDRTMFDQFYEQYPIYVIRPDGTKGFLRANINKCRREYNHIVGKSKAMHEHLLKCLQYEVQNKMLTGKLGYMKTMWKWLTQHEWEAIEDQLNDQPVKYEAYGTGIL